MMHGAGSDPPDVIQGKVININLVRWTVDVYSTFDRKRYMDVPVGSPYLHYSNGEGLSIMPEVGSVCYLCVPGDSSGPFVLCFVMPHETVDTAADDAPQGTRSRGQPTGSSDATFAGNRPRAKPGDIELKTRDGNFVRLHRGGVLQIGATELAQRIYVPLNNLVTDISENYNHLNTGGTIAWGIQDGASEEKFPSQYLHTFRIFAKDKYADCKLAVGRVFNQLREDGSGVGNDDDNPTMVELAIKPQGFDAVTGDEATDSKEAGETVLHFLFDKKGNGFVKLKGNVKLVIEKKFEMTVKAGMEISVEGDVGITGDSLVQIVGKSGVHVKGKVVRLGPGKLPVARQGDLVSCFVAAMPMMFVPLIPVGGPTPHPAGTPIPGTLTIGPPGGAPPVGIPGQITSGEPTVLA
jgi:hypothetical protein